ncbi:uncharacterized protein METZ01_LOCUS512210, partial [marine metagenome]
MVNLTFTTMTFSQDIGSDWINVRGMNNDQIESLIREEIKTLRTARPDMLERVMEKMNKDNDARITEFNDTKTSLRSNLNSA